MTQRNIAFPEYLNSLPVLREKVHRKRHTWNKGTWPFRSRWTQFRFYGSKYI